MNIKSTGKHVIHVIRKDQLPDNLTAVVALDYAYHAVKDSQPAGYWRKRKIMLVASYNSDGDIVIREVSNFRRKLP